MKYYIFLDESGNTGTNWLDKDQKLFSYGGWLIAEDKLKDVSNLFEIWSIKRQGAKEYKSNKLFKIEKSKVEIEKLILEITSKSLATPFFLVFEKKFMVACKIVETFFDPEYNSLLSNKITQPYEIKRQLANIIYNDGNGFLEQFSDILSLKDLSLATMETLKRDLVNLFQNKKLSEVEYVIRNTTEEGLLAMINEFNVVSDSGSSKTLLTLTIPGIIALFHNINLFSEMIDADSVSVIHDELRGYKERFQHISENFFHDGRTLEIFEVDGRSISNNFTKFKHFEWEKSENSNLLQLADLLNGFLQYTIKKMYSSDEELSALEKDIWKSLVILKDIIYECSRAMMWDVYFPYHIEQKFFKLLNPDYELKQIDYEKEIKSNFSSFLR